MLGITALALWPAFAQAVEPNNFTLKTTADLYQVCSTAPDDPLRREAAEFCQGFLLGVVSYHDAISDKEHLKPFICYPQTATRDQGVQAFVDWAAAQKQNQKFMNDPPVVGAVRGLAAKWPCK
jgi:hypothetical protein